MILGISAVESLVVVALALCILGPKRTQVLLKNILGWLSKWRGFGARVMKSVSSSDDHKKKDGQDE